MLPEQHAVPQPNAELHAVSDADADAVSVTHGNAVVEPDADRERVGDAVADTDDDGYPDADDDAVPESVWLAELVRQFESDENAEFHAERDADRVPDANS